jgi:PPOX class probable F420-dependent enzyme
MPKRYSTSEVKRFLRGRHVAVLGTIGPSGEPVLTPIWYLHRDDKILMRTGRDSAKAKNIRKDGRVTVCVQDERAPYASITVYGLATVEAEEPGLGASIARRYLGAIAGAAYLKAAAEVIERDGGEVTLVVSPGRVVSQDFSAETPIYGRAWLALKRVLPPWL